MAPFAAPKAALNAYRSIQTESVAHGGKGAELVVMLYDGIVESLANAAGLMERKEYREAGRQFSRAMTILAGLRETLDFEQGQPVAGNLLKF
jgi:flagellar secretion chaperone FliS